VRKEVRRGDSALECKGASWKACVGGGWLAPSSSTASSVVRMVAGRMGMKVTTGGGPEPRASYTPMRSIRLGGVDFRWNWGV